MKQLLLDEPTIIEPLAHDKNQEAGRPPVRPKSFLRTKQANNTALSTATSLLKGNCLKDTTITANNTNLSRNTVSILDNKGLLPIGKSLHILLVTETWLPDINGVSLSLYQLMKQLIADGHTVSLLRPRPKQIADVIKDVEGDGEPQTICTAIDSPESDSKAVVGKTVESKTVNSTSTTVMNVMPPNTEHFIHHDIHVKGIAIPRYPDLQGGMPAYRHIKRNLKRISPDIVHIATEGPLGLAALLAAKRQKIAVTTGYHTQFHDFSRYFGFGALARPLMMYFKWFHNASKATCVPSRKTYNDLDVLGFKRLVEVGRGVDKDRFNPERRSEALRTSWGVSTQHTVVIMVSRLSPEKGVDLVIKGFQSLQREQLHRALKLVIVGDGPDKARLQTLAEQCGDDVVFTGAQTGTALAVHYASGDAFVFGSQVETFGNVVTEAMASGLPVYAFDNAAAAMLVDEHTGRLVALGDKAAFINMVSQLPKMHCLKEQGQQAVQQVASFSWQRPAEQMLTMFYQAIG